MTGVRLLRVHVAIKLRLPTRIKYMYKGLILGLSQCVVQSFII